ncbi:pyruvate dehydrogenase (acetyl-transferring) E1 component subunit alpha [Streptomyces carpaticus]|uniref:Pyruvate dehydrogenase E1 component subunit alpha n=1 Tax=Streptomyces carpaticus TaxID=285558 RepID=A0ABV4ZNJ4_9ACTN
MPTNSATTRSTRASRSASRKTRKNPPGPAGATPSAERLLDFYRQMVLIRRFEERAARAYTEAKIGGYCHLNLGEEATVVGLMAALEETDYLFTNYREHGYAIARGIAPERVMAELYGRTDGVSRGWGGSMHMFDIGTRFMGGYGIVGGQVPLATGAALAIDYRGGTEAAMCLMGDGTTNIGAFHESLNIAALWDLPIVYVIVNNGLGMGTTVEQSSAEPALYKRAAAYRMASARVDGNDPVAVHEAARAALAEARRGKPYLLETVSGRLKGHSVVDPAKYRSKEEAQALKAADPIARYAVRLSEEGLLTDALIAEIDTEATAAARAAAEFADTSPHPEVSTLFDYTYATPVANDARQLPGDALFPAAPRPTVQHPGV